MEAGQPRWDLHHVRSLLCVAKIRKKIPDGDLQESRVGVGKPKRYLVVFIFQHDNFLVTDFLQIKTD